MGAIQGLAKEKNGLITPLFPSKKSAKSVFQCGFSTFMTSKNDCMNTLNRFSVLVFTTILATSCHTSNIIVSVNSPRAPKAIGPYSHAVISNTTIYCSGQVGISPTTGNLVSDNINDQTKQALDNLKAVVEDAHSDMEHVAKVTIYMTDLSDFGKVNEIYQTYFPGIKPARATVQVAKLPKNALIEIDCIAVLK